jgi:glyoxalase family protein
MDTTTTLHDSQQATNTGAPDALTGLHHVTAITAAAADNIRFYTGTLGMRLTKKTVNQDDVSAYHLFYGDAVASPGSELTFFDWDHAAPRRRGLGTVAATGLRVASEQALEWWARRLTSAGVVHSDIIEENGRATLHFLDPEGQSLVLVDDRGLAHGTTWRADDIVPEHGVKGLGPATIEVADPRLMSAFLTDVLGFRQVNEYAARTSPDTAGEARVLAFATAAGDADAQLHLTVRPDATRGRFGRGGVHHVALRTPTDATQIAWRERLAAAGFEVTPVIDRFYFHSIYFMTPSGVLFEIATDGPGMTADEPLDQLGERLSLPPFLEGRRAEIEKGLAPL